MCGCWPTGHPLCKVRLCIVYLHSSRLYIVFCAMLLFDSWLLPLRALSIMSHWHVRAQHASSVLPNYLPRSTCSLYFTLHSLFSCAYGQLVHVTVSHARCLSVSSVQLHTDATARFGSKATSTAAGETNRALHHTTADSHHAMGMAAPASIAGLKKATPNSTNALVHIRLQVTPSDSSQMSSSMFLDILGTAET